MLGGIRMDLDIGMTGLMAWDVQYRERRTEIA